MSDKKFCDFCGIEIELYPYEESVYYKVTAEYIVGECIANNYYKKDMCIACYKKGVIVREES